MPKRCSRLAAGREALRGRANRALLFEVLPLPLLPGRAVPPVAAVPAAAHVWLACKVSATEDGHALVWLYRLPCEAPPDRQVFTALRVPESEPIDSRRRRSMVVETRYLAYRAPFHSTTTELPRPLSVPVVHIRPRSAAALVPDDVDPGPMRVERLLRLARKVLPRSVMS